MYHTLLTHFPIVGHLYYLPFLFLLLKIAKCAGYVSFVSAEPLFPHEPRWISSKGSLASGFAWTQSGRCRLSEAGRKVRVAHLSHAGHTEALSKQFLSPGSGNHYLSALSGLEWALVPPWGWPQGRTSSLVLSPHPAHTL